VSATERNHVSTRNQLSQRRVPSTKQLCTVRTSDIRL